jgi:hypothetical protein
MASFFVGDNITLFREISDSVRRAANPREREYASTRLKDFLKDAYLTDAERATLRGLYGLLPEWWCSTEEELCELLYRGIWWLFGPEDLEALCRHKGIRWSLRLQCIVYSYVHLGGDVIRTSGSLILSERVAAGKVLEECLRQVTKLFHRHRRVEWYISHLANLIVSKGWRRCVLNQDVEMILEMSAFSKPRSMRESLRSAVISKYEYMLLEPTGRPKPGYKHYYLDLRDHYINPAEYIIEDYESIMDICKR